MPSKEPYSLSKTAIYSLSKRAVKKSPTFGQKCPIKNELGICTVSRMPLSLPNVCVKKNMYFVKRDLHLVQSVLSRMNLAFVPCRVGNTHYGVATVSRLLKIIGLFCRI